jgi:Flp pilus assembly protein TadB
MGMFGKDKKDEILDAMKKSGDERRRKLEEIVKSTELGLPTAKKLSKHSTVYQNFLDELKHKPKTKFEKVCKICEPLGVFSLGEKTELSLKEDITASYINANVQGIKGFSIGAFALFFLLSTIFLIGMGDLFFGLGLFFVGGITSLNILNYAGKRAETLVVRMSADTILAILYMVIYMRSSPNLVGALKFTAENLDGELSWDLKKLVWDIQVGVYPNADSALAKYAMKWREKNPEFAEAINLLRGSAVGNERREKLYDEIIKVVLDGTADRTKKYVSQLRMPVMIIHAMGVLLPVMGLVLFPIIVIFMADTVKPIFLFVGYDVLLPIALLFFINKTLANKPPTFSQPDLKLVKGIPKMGTFRAGNKIISSFIPPAIVILVFVIISFVFFLDAFDDPFSESGMTFSVFFIVSIAAAIIAYCYFDSKDKKQIRKDIERIENEFSVALFQLGNQISSGKPIEKSMDGAANNMKGMKISRIFYDTSANMKQFGYTFDQALFDDRVGAVWKYPSKLVHSIMKVVSDSSKKGMKASSSAMLTISRYLKGMHDVKGDVQESLGETVSSMSFLATFLAPMIAGLTITMAVIILQILTSLGDQVSSLVVDQSGAGMSTVQYGFLFGAGMNGGSLPIGPVEFQFIVGLYMIETVLVLSLFINKIEYGDDAIGLRDTIVKTLLVSTIVYIVSWYFTGLLFGDPIKKLLTPT